MEHYEFFSLQSMKINDGDPQKADYFLDCSIYEWYYRQKIRNQWVDYHNEQVKRSMKNT